MDNNEFKSKALRTEPSTEAYEAVYARLNYAPVGVALIDTLSKLEGLLSKLDEIKKYLFYGKESPYLVRHEKKIYPILVEAFDGASSETKAKRFADPLNVRLLHGVIGVATESGELIEALLKITGENNVVDRVNIMEETGDIAWYMAILADALKYNVDDANEKVINKLMKRFPDKFDEGSAINRDLKTERETLEG